MRKNTPADNMYEALKNNPQEIIDWCNREIAEYQKLKKLIIKSIKNNKKSQPIHPRSRKTTKRKK